MELIIGDGTIFIEEANAIEKDFFQVGYLFV
jgi:hypothetical protein